MSKFMSMKDDEAFDPDNRFKDDGMDVMDRQYDSLSNIRPYILASFGSVWACMRVCLNF